MNNHPILSIIIPLYNCERYIKQCLDSIYWQDINESEYEVIVVDDGSKDNGFQIVSEYAQKHDNINLIHQENQGVACARNNAIKIAKGLYITFIDADDLIVPESLKLMLNNAIEFKADIVKGAIVEVPESTHYEEYKLSDAGNVCDVMNGNEAIVKVTRYKEGYSTGYLIRNRLIKDNNICFPPKVAFMEDWAFITQAILKSKVFVNTDVLFYLYRRNTSSCVANMSTEKLLQACRSIEIVAKTALYTDGAVMRKLFENVCVNINIILWYTIHYRSIYRDRKEISRVLVQLLKLVNPQYIPNSLKPFLLFPCMYIYVRHLMASRKY